MDNNQNEMQAMVDFECLSEDCNSSVCFNVMELCENHGQTICPDCHRSYHFEEEFIDKLKRLRKLILAVKDAEDILGDVNIAVTTMAGEVKIPYRLLMTRLNSIISLNVGDRKVDFNFRIEPLNEGHFK